MPTPIRACRRSRREIDKAWNEAEPLIESYNAVHEQFAQNKAKQAALENQIRPSEAPGRPGRRPGSA
jgi:hypothetical protein